jgi:hypothetical protein
MNKKEVLFQKATSAKGADQGKNTIYSFVKYCKNCNQGLVKPESHERRIVKHLFSRGYCCQYCEENKNKVLINQVVPKDNKNLSYQSTFPSKCKNQQTFTKNTAIEDFAFESIEQEKLDQVKNTKIQRLVLKAHFTYRTIYEKLAFLEQETRKYWNPSKFYYWLRKK